MKKSLAVLMLSLASMSVMAKTTNYVCDLAIADIDSDYKIIDGSVKSKAGAKVDVIDYGDAFTMFGKIKSPHLFKQDNPGWLGAEVDGMRFLRMDTSNGPVFDFFSMEEGQAIITKGCKQQ